MKKCSHCGEVKELLKFDKNKAHKDGADSLCKPCRRVYRRQHYLLNKKKILSQTREYYYNNIEAGKAYRKEYYLNHKEVYAKTSRKHFLRRMYNLTEEDISRMKIEQNNECSICKVTFDKVSPFVDHCHDTRKVRGLLCPNCNTGLGKFKDSIKILYAAAEYLNG